MRVLIIFFIGILNAGIIANVSFLFSQYFHSQPLFISLAVTTFYISAFISTLVLSTLSDYFRYHLGLLFAISATVAIGLLINGLLGLRPFAIACLLVLVAPSASLSSIFFAYISEVEPDKAKGVALRGVFSGAWVIGPVLSTQLVASAGFDWLFRSLFLVALVVALASMIHNQKYPYIDDVSDTVDMKSEGMGLLIGGFVVMTILQGAMGLSTTFLPIIITREISFDHADTGIAFSITALSEIFFIFLMARFFRDISILSVMLLGCVMGVVYYVIISFTSSINIIFWAQILNGFYIATMIGIGMIWFQNLAPGRPGLAMGLFVNSYSLGSIVFTPVIGIVAEGLGSFQKAALSGACGIMIGMMMLLMIHVTEAGR